MFNNLKITQKLTLSIGTIALLGILGVSLILYVTAGNIVKMLAERELQAVTTSTHFLIQTTLDTSLENYRNTSIENFQKRLSSLTFGKTGYLFVLNSQGKMIIHPEREDDNAYDYQDAKTGAYFIRAMCTQKTGKLTYYWQNPGEQTISQNMVIYAYIKELDWILGSSIDTAELFQPVSNLRSVMGSVLLFFSLFIVAAAIFAGNTLTKPFNHLCHVVSNFSMQDLALRATVPTTDEVGKLAGVFNTMLDQLEEIVKERTTEMNQANLQLQHEMRERKHSGEALQASEEKYRTLFESLFDVFYRTDNEGHIMLVSPSITELLGYTTEEAVGMHFGQEIFARPDQWEEFQKIMTGKGYLDAFEVLLKRKYRSEVWGSASAQFYTDKDGKILGMEGIIRDITERKQAERELRKVLKQLRQRVDELDTLNRITRMVASTLDLAIMLNAVCHELGLLFKASSTGVALFNPQQTELTIFADYSINTELPDILGFPLPLKKNHFIRRMLKVGKSVVVSHAQTNPISKPLHDLLCKRDVQSIMLVPLRSRGVIIGVIGINSDEPDRDFTPDEISLAETIAGQVAGAIENAQLFTESKRSETTLLEANKELKDTLENLRRTQAQLIQSEKMAALGQLIAGVAHEINTPLGAIRASIGNIAHAFKETIQHFSEFQQLSPEQIADVMSLVHHVVQEQRVLTSREERQLKKMLRNELHAHGLNSAHELADTLVDMGFYGDLAPFIALFQSEHQTLMMLIAYNLAIQYRNNQNITTAVERAAKIVFALKSYARYDPSAQQTKAVISEGIECVLTLYCNQLKYGIEIIKHYEDVPAIPCYPDELNQVWTNLIHNAIQAMEGQGTLEITVGRRPKVENSSAALHDEDEPISRNHYVVVQITDSGHGIPAELQVRIFEPFFTTKSSGEGSGLGLDICHRIIEKHQGKIEVESQPGKTTFSVWLPV